MPLLGGRKCLLFQLPALWCVAFHFLAHAFKAFHLCAFSFYDLPRSNTITSGKSCSTSLLVTARHCFVLATAQEDGKVLPHLFTTVFKDKLLISHIEGVTRTNRMQRHIVATKLQYANMSNCVNSSANEPKCMQSELSYAQVSVSMAELGNVESLHKGCNIIIMQSRAVPNHFFL